MTRKKLSRPCLQVILIRDKIWQSMVPVAQRQSIALWMRGLWVRNPSGTLEGESIFNGFTFFTLSQRKYYYWKTGMTIGG